MEKVKVKSKPKTAAPKKLLVDETIGRPAFPYTEEIAKAICHEIATTTDSLQTICKKNPHFPSHSTIVSWRVYKPEFSIMYFDAKRQQVHAFVEQTFDLSDEANEESQGSIAKRKMQIENRRWYASRLIPRLYGDKIQAETISAEAEELKSTVAQLQATIALLKKHERDY